MNEERIQCHSCGTSYNKMFLIGKQGNTNICPLCGAKMQTEDVEEHSDWITWWYYKDPLYGDYCLFDKPPLRSEELELIKEFQAPPKDENGNCDAAKRELRKYVPDAFAETPPTHKVICPRCFGTEIQLVPRRFSILTGFATNKIDRVCVRCQKKF